MCVYGMCCSGYVVPKADTEEQYHKIVQVCCPNSREMCQAGLFPYALLPPYVCFPPTPLRVSPPPPKCAAPLHKLAQLCCHPTCTWIYIYIYTQ